MLVVGNECEVKATRTTMVIMFCRCSQMAGSWRAPFCNKVFKFCVHIPRGSPSYSA